MPKRIPSNDKVVDGLMPPVSSNRVSTFPLATKVVVTATTKLAIPKGDVCAAAMSSASNDEGGHGDEDTASTDSRRATLILITFYEAVAKLCVKSYRRPEARFRSHNSQSP